MDHDLKHLLYFGINDNINTNQDVFFIIIFFLLPGRNKTVPVEKQLTFEAFLIDQILLHLIWFLDSEIEREDNQSR